jgi:hypothetical protein
MGLLDDFSLGDWPGLLNTPTGQLPPRRPPAPLFVPSMEAAYGGPAPGESWNTNPLPFGKAMDGLAENLATKLAAMKARAMAPEPADHGFSERRKLSLLQAAINPITSYPETYLRMDQGALDQMSHGIDQLSHPYTDQAATPASGSESDAVAPHPLSNVAKGVGNIAFGALGHIAAPINAAYRSVIGQPLEDLTGIPREYIETAAQLATPGLGLLAPFGKRAAVPPRPGPSAPFGVSLPEREATQALPSELPKTVSPATEIALRKTGRTEMTPDGREAPVYEGAMPELATRYPKTGPAIWTVDPKTGKGYWAKQDSQEEVKLKAVLNPIQRDIDAGNFTPHYDPAKRSYADRTYYPRVMDTGDLKAVRKSTQEKHEAIARSPEATQRLDETFQRGQLQEEDARDFSAVGDVEQDFIKELGPEQGRKAFKELAESVAATSPGADPRANLRAAQYARYMRAKGSSFPTIGADIPYPAGSRFGAPNLRQFQKMLMESSGIASANPKLYDYASELLGHTDLGPPIDEQRFRLMDPVRSAPPQGTYGHYKGALTDQAAAHGVSPVYYGDMVYAGAQKTHWIKPLISYINEMIERTHRVTGMARDEIVRRGLVRAEIPMFGAGGMMVDTKQHEDDHGN